MESKQYYLRDIRDALNGKGPSLAGINGNSDVKYLKDIADAIRQGGGMSDDNDKVKQLPTDDENKEYRVLLSKNDNDTTETDFSHKDGKLTYNPHTNHLTIHGTNEGDGVSIGETTVESKWGSFTGRLDNGVISTTLSNDEKQVMAGLQSMGESPRVYTSETLFDETTHQQTSYKSAALTPDDVQLYGEDNTWDGEHTSLKDALAGGGGGSSSGIIEEVLFFNENETMNLTYVDLPNHIKKYDYIYMEGWHWWDGHKSRESGLYKVSDLQIGDRLGIFCNGLHCWFQLDSWTRLNVIARSHDYCIYTMVGIMLKEKEVKTKILTGDWLSLVSRMELPYKIQANYEVGAEFFIDDMTYRGDSAIIGNTLNHNYLHFNPATNNQNDSAISNGVEQVAVRLDTVGEHTIIFNKNGGDGNYYDSNKITDYTPTDVDGNLVIGQRAENDNWNNLFTGKIGNVYIKDTETNEPVCDLKPAKRHQYVGEFEAIDYGFYDTINDVFYAFPCLVSGISSACIEDLSIDHGPNYGNVAICDSNYNTYGVAFYDNERPLAPSRAFDGDMYSVWSNNDTGYANAFIAYLHYNDIDEKIPTFDTFEIGQTSILTDRPMQNVTYTLWYGIDHVANPNRSSNWTKVADITMITGVNSVKFEPISNATRIMVTVSNNNIGWASLVAINHIQLYDSKKEA